VWTEAAEPEDGKPAGREDAEPEAHAAIVGGAASGLVEPQ
jgi:hypothetical protein